jgi:peptide/nickel transport system substrate-binding protein
MDKAEAKALVAEAGYPDGIQVKMDIVAQWSDAASYAEILKQDAAAAGIDIQINTMPESAYWDIWTETDLAVTIWTHRPLGVMVLPLAYVCDSGGKPVPWNETRWCDEEFATLLTQAQGTLDVEKRRELMCKIEDIQMERGSIGVAFWKNIWSITDKKYKNVITIPTWLDRLHEVWLDPEA